MLTRAFLRALTALAVVAMLVGPASIYSPPAQAFEQGMVTVTQVLGAWARAQRSCRGLLRGHVRR